MSSIVAFLLGGMFIVVQVLSYNGYMLVNYDRVKKDVEEVLDLNKDGVLDGKDAEVAINKLTDVLTYNMPASGGFTAGLFLGLK